MRECAWYRVRFGFAGNAPANLPEAPAAQRLGVPSLSSRELRPQAAPARPQGVPVGAKPLSQSLPTFCWPESRGPARPERVEGKIKIFKRRKKGKETSRQKSPGAAAPKTAPERVKGKLRIFKRRKKGKETFRQKSPGAAGSPKSPGGFAPKNPHFPLANCRRIFYNKRYNTAIAAKNQKESGRKGGSLGSARVLRHRQPRIQRR